MRKPIVSFVFTLIVLLSFSFAAAGEKVTVISYQKNVKALTNSDFVSRLIALSEWEPFFETFTNECDKALQKELSREKLGQHLPGVVVDEIRKFLESELSTRKMIEDIFQHLESVLFELQVDSDSNQLKKLLDLLQSREKNSDIGVNGLLAFVIDVNPRPALGILKYFREGNDYNFLRNEPDGDFVLKFNFELQNKNIEFCVAGLRLSGGNYAVLFSAENSMTRHCEWFKTGKYSQLDLSQPKMEFVFEEPCFHFLNQKIKQLNPNLNGADFLGKVKSAKMDFHDVNGVSQLALTAVMQNTVDAAALRDMLTGLLAFAQLNQGENSSERELLRAIKVNASENEVSVAIKLDNPEFWELIAKGLNKAKEEIQNRQ